MQIFYAYKDFKNKSKKNFLLNGHLKDCKTFLKDGF